MTAVSCRPNLFLVGAPRCGTTALYTYLAGHPRVFMSPVKELHYFSTDLYQPAPQIKIESERAYLAMFRSASDEPWRGEASPYYLYSAVAPEAIKLFSPDARIIITLRNPVDMMYSLYCLRVRAAIFHTAQEPLRTFAQALDAGPARLRGEQLPPGVPQEPGRCLYLCYRELGRYADRVARFLDVFGREAIHAIVFDDLVANTAGVYRDLCRYLGIEADAVPDPALSRARRAAGAAPRSSTLARLLWRPPATITRAARKLLPQSTRRTVRRVVERWNDRPPPMLNSAMRQALLDDCASDIARLSHLLGRDLTAWTRSNHSDD